MPRSETRELPYAELHRAVVEHYRGQGQMVDFRIMPRGAIVAAYRVRDGAEAAWQDLLPVGVSAETYQEVIQRLAPILFPGESATIRAVGREGDRALVRVELPD